MGFLLDKKKWVKISIASLSRIDFYQHPFNALQLDLQKKKLIRALVREFTATGSQSFKGFDDIVQAKGRGLFFLLHGGSGLGKTFTAGKPVLLSTCPFISLFVFPQLGFCSITLGEVHR
jgi:hypothetical protein